MSSIYHTEHYSLLTDPGSGVTIMNNTTRRSASTFSRGRMLLASMRN